MKSVDNKVLVLGNYRHALTVIRSLGRAGYYVIAGKDGQRSFTDHSRYTAEVWQHPKVEDNESNFVAALNEFLAKRDEIPMIFPIGDTQISCIARHIGQLPASVAVVMPDPITAINCQNKSHVYTTNERLGISQPAFEKAYSYTELRSSIERIGYPCVIKPNDSFTPFLGEKAIIIHSAEEMTASIPAWPEAHKYLVVQKYARGDRHTCHFVAVGGEILSYFEFKVLRTDRRDGTGYLVEGVSVRPTVNLKEQCQALARELEYSGVGSVQFLVDDSTDSVNFLEINPRLGASCALAFYCGYDLPKMAVENAEFLMGKRVERSKETSDYPAGKRVVWLMGDIQGILRDWRAGRLDLGSATSWLKNMATTFARGDFHVTWWWKDPLPTLIIYGQLLKSLFRKMKRVAFKK